MGMRDQYDLLLEFLYSEEKRIKRKMVVHNRTQLERKLRPVESDTTPKIQKCLGAGEKRCEDGSCIIARVELCPEEKLMNQNTILIMIVVGLAVVVFLVILYCFQQRQRRANRELDTIFSDDDCDNASLNAPPPAYEEVINTNLYPPTPEQRRLRQFSVEEPMTPPPNYDAALVILAQSQDSVFSKSIRRTSSVFRRSVSHEHVNNNRQSAAPSEQNINELQDTPIKCNKDKKFKGVFRFSRTHGSANGNANTIRYSPSPSPGTLGSPPPYPQTPPIYPLTPPPPLTPLTPNPSQPLVATDQQQITEQETIS